jgi:tungstate transport system ATP-binding protein
MKSIVVAMSAIKLNRGLKPVLDIASLQVTAGELIAVIGPNGAGKSTLLQAINLLLPFHQGRLSLFGEDAAIVDSLTFRRRCAMVFQDPLFINDTVYNNVALPLRFRGLRQTATEQRVIAALETFHCAHLAQRQAFCLSGGEAKRVCLARALVCEPELLLLDEPFTALDPATGKTLLSELRQVAIARGMTVIMVSHNLSNVLQFTDRAIVMEKGCIVQDDSPETVLRRPGSLEIAELVGMDNVFGCQVVETPLGRVLYLADEIGFPYPGQPLAPPAYCCLPGDIFFLEDSGSAEDPSRVTLNGTVRQVIPGIGVYQVVVEVGSLEFHLRLSRAQAARRLLAGQTIRFAFDLQEAHFIR